MKRQRAFLICPTNGCNRKYQKNEQWVKHITSVHNVEQPTIPERVTVSKSKSGCTSNKKITQNTIVKEAQRLRDPKRAAKQQAEEILKEQYGNNYKQQTID